VHSKFCKTDTKIIIVKSGRNGDETQCNSSKNYTVNGKNVIYPKDPKAGTWYVVDENGTVRSTEWS
jgi:hypothetical protein